MFVIKKFYKHVNNTDVCIQVHGVLNSDELGISLVASWWNIVAKTPFPLTRQKVVWIVEEQRGNWKEYGAMVSR